MNGMINYSFILQIGREQMLHSGMLESVPEDVVPLNDRNLSSFSDVEILEQFDSKKNGGSDGETSSPHAAKIVHVHFEDLNASQGEDISVNQELPKEHGVKEYVVQPNQQRASGSSDNRGLSRAAGSDGKQTHRNGRFSSGVNINEMSNLKWNTMYLPQHRDIIVATIYMQSFRNSVSMVGHAEIHFRKNVKIFKCFINKFVSVS